LLPLRVGLIGEEIVSAMKRITALDESKDRVVINIKGVRAAKFGDYVP